MGRRRFWLLVVQPLLAGACAVLALTDPGLNAAHTAMAAAALTFLSASQDILIDAWRIESFPETRQGAALAAYVWGYRTAMLTSGSGAIALSTVLGWHGAMLCMAGLLALAPLLTLNVAEPRVHCGSRRRDLWRRSGTRFLSHCSSSLCGLAPRRFWRSWYCFDWARCLPTIRRLRFTIRGLGFSSGVVASANFLPSLLGVFGGAAFGGWLVARLGDRTCGVGDGGAAGGVAGAVCGAAGVRRGVDAVRQGRR
ncbi:MAG: MFS transporter [Rhodospirillales bacterium]